MRQCMKTREVVLMIRAVIFMAVLAAVLDMAGTAMGRGTCQAQGRVVVFSDDVG
jgi:hypothetical protein